MLHSGVHGWHNDQVTRICGSKTSPDYHPSTSYQMSSMAELGLCTNTLKCFCQTWRHAFWPDICTFVLSVQRTMIKKLWFVQMLFCWAKSCFHFCFTEKRFLISPHPTKQPYFWFSITHLPPTQPISSVTSTKWVYFLFTVTVVVV